MDARACLHLIRTESGPEVGPGLRRAACLVCGVTFTVREHGRELIYARMNCAACANSYMEPSGPAVLICGHPDAGPFGSAVARAVSTCGHCGPSLSKFAQHPGRHPNGDLMS